MSKLSTIISAEYRLEVKSRTFWITTFLFPIIIIAIGGFVGYLMTESESMQEVGKMSPAPSHDISGMQLLGMMSGMLLFMFITMYGAMIFNKVKAEKTNRIVEILVSCVPGRTLMFGKVITVGLIGLTQMLTWFALVGVGLFALAMLVPGIIPFSELFSMRVAVALGVTLLFFLGGFCFYGALFAFAGAITDRNNENQGYMSLIMMLLMVSFYLGIFSVDNTGALASVSFFVPFTSPTTGPAQSIAGFMPWYATVISLLILYGCAAISLILAGKAYTSAILLKGKKLSPKDIITFLKAK